MAVKKGEQLSQAWWLNIARENIISKYQGDNINATLWYMNMKNRFGWKDKQETSFSADTLQTFVDAMSNKTIGPPSERD